MILRSNGSLEMCQQGGNFENIRDVETGCAPPTRANSDVHLTHVNVKHRLISWIVTNANATATIFHV
jgi:hypothetical protein